MLDAESVEEAKAFLLQRYPHAHFGQWEQAPRNLNMGVWENAAVRLRFEMGEKEDKHRPVAYISQQDWPWPTKLKRVKIDGR